MRKCCIPYIPCRSLLLSTTVLNDNIMTRHTLKLKSVFNLRNLAFIQVYKQYARGKFVYMFDIEKLKLIMRKFVKLKQLKRNYKTASQCSQFI